MLFCITFFKAIQNNLQKKINHQKKNNRKQLTLSQVAEHEALLL